MSIQNDAALRCLESSKSIYDAVQNERYRAHAKHVAQGRSMEGRTWFDDTWLPVLVEEVGEIARALNDDEGRSHLREELIQTAAMACAWIAAIDEAERMPHNSGVQIEGGQP